MSQSGPAVAMNVRRSTPGPGGGKGEGGAGESPDTNTTCGGQQDRMGRDGRTGRSSRTAAVLSGRILYQKQSRKQGEPPGDRGGRGGQGDGVPHQMCFCMLVLEEEGGLEDTSSILKGLGGADRKSAKRFLVFAESFPPPDQTSSLGARPTGRGQRSPRRTTF